MLVIRDSQAKTLEDAARSGFEQQLSTHLGVPPEHISTYINSAVAQGLTRKRDVAQYVAYSVSQETPNQSAPPLSDELLSKKSLGAVTIECPSPQPLHWLEIQLLGEDDSPIPGETYRITLPDGSTSEGTLDENGSARVASIVEPGACQITFPLLDRSAWEPI